MRSKRRKLETDYENQWFSTRNDFKSGDIFGCHNATSNLLGRSSPVMLLKILRHTGQPHKTEL